jgi:hypothetical protein
MIKWAKENKRLINKENVVLISPAMNKTVYEINKENCYFVMAPYFNKYAEKDSDNLFYVKYSVYLRKIDNEFKKRLRYSLEKGFEEREELQHSPH